MQRIFETFLERLSESIDEVDFREAMAGAAEAFDLPLFAYMVLQPASAETTRLISNYPDGWTQHYLRNRYQDFDPVILRATGGGCPFRWSSDCVVIATREPQRQVLDEASEFGIARGLTIPIVDRRGCMSAVTFAVDELNPVFLRVADRYEQALQLMATCFHIHVRRKLSTNRLVDGVLLTPREYECLQWAARGKSAWDIGCILGIKRRTAAFHLDNARRKLGVRTVAQAVARLARSQSSLH